MAQAEAQLDNLRNTPTPEDLRLAEQSVRQAQITLEQAESNLRKSQLIAPFDGIVADLNIQIGQRVAAGEQTATLVDLSYVKAQVDVAEADAPRLKLGQAAQVTFDALPGSVFSGTVTTMALAEVRSQGVVNYPVTVVLDSTDSVAVVRPGLTANVAIVIEQHENVLLVPIRAIKTVGDQKTVTVLSGGKQTQVGVTVGFSDDIQAEVTSGLNEGDTVVIQPTTATWSFGFGPGGGPGEGGPA